MKKIVILHSDVPPDAGIDEQDTLQQANIIARAISLLGYDPVLLPFNMDLNATTAALRSLDPFVVFNLVETVAGRGSMVFFATALLDALDIPYTGCRTDAMFLSSNKPLTKKILHSEGIATPAWLTSDGIAVGLPLSDIYILKASWEDASVGLDDSSIVQADNCNTLLAALRYRIQYLHMDCFAETYIDGREFNIALLSSNQGVRVLPVSEILFDDYPPDKFKVLDYRAKWVEESFEYDKTRRTLLIDKRDIGLVNSLHDISLQCWRIFGLRGYARVDFRVDHNGNPWVLEINANPCLSPDAGFAAALEHASIMYSEAIDDIIQDALIKQGG